MFYTLTIIHQFQRKLKSRLDELLAHIERNKASASPESAINMEYLKNCIYRFMVSSEHSEKMRLYPVVATILRFTSDEVNAIQESLENQEFVSSEGAIADISSYAVSSFNEFVFGSPSLQRTAQNSGAGHSMS